MVWITRAAKGGWGTQGRGKHPQRIFSVLFLPSQWAQKRHLGYRGTKITVRQCLSEIVSQLSRNYPHRGHENCESKIVSRQWGDSFRRETSRCLAGPSGLRVIFIPFKTSITWMFLRLFLPCKINYCLAR